jgi:hypothetical protein
MPANEYYQKQIALLLLWILATTDRGVKQRLLAQALNLLTRENLTDAETLCEIQELFSDFVQSPPPLSK